MRWPWNRTQARRGYLRGIGKELGNRLSTPTGWVAPRYLDLRPYCLPKDDQGDLPWCAGFSMAGLLEARNWKSTHIPLGVDPGPLYNAAKKIDGDTSDGTTLTSIFSAAKAVGLLPKSATAIYFNTFAEYTFALHKYGPCVLGFRIDNGWSYANKDGWIPDGNEELGGHAVLGCWYDVRRGAGFQNSWGEWGADGFGRMTVEQFSRSFIGGLAVEIPGE